MSDVSSSYLKSEAQTWASRASRPTKRAKRDAETDAGENDEAEETAESAAATEESDSASASAKRLVVHLGSDFVRVGRSNDLYPTLVPNVVARRGAEPHPLPPSPEPMPASEASFETLRAELRSIMRQYKLRPVTHGWQSANSYNASVQPEKIAEHNDVYHVGFVDEASIPGPIAVGQEALRLSSLSSGEPSMWTLFRPWARGMLNVETYATSYGTSCIEALLGDVQHILRHAFSLPSSVPDGSSASPGLGIPEAEYGDYSVLLLVPDSFSRRDIRALGHVLLRYMGFAALHVQTEGLCATFGAGLSAACVVDIGATSIGISCVEEGLVLPETRITLSYGGRDMSAFFGDVLRGSSFPYKELDLQRRVCDMALLDELKERFVTLQPSQVGLNLYDFTVRWPGVVSQKYALRLYDEPILAGLMLFHPELVAAMASSRPLPFPRRRWSSASVETSMVDEPELLNTLSMTNPSLGGNEASELTASATHDLTPTLAMFGCVQTKVPDPVMALVDPSRVLPAVDTTTATSSPAPPGGGGASTPMNATSSPAPGATDGPTASATEATEKTAAIPAKNGPASSKGTTSSVPQTSAMASQAAKCQAAAMQAAQAHDIDIVGEAAMTPLDRAVFQSLLASTGSIDGTLNSGAEERLRRLANNIVCIGGAARISGLAEALEARVSMLLAEHYTPSDPARVPAVQVPASFTAPQAVVIPPPRNLDPASLAWKGLAVLAHLDAMQELWVQAADWDTLGYRALKEKSLFL
ncbi:Ino80 complex protein [Malassezia pachydermatis]